MTENTTTDHLTVVNHPLVTHKLSIMRRVDTSTSKFRQLLREISMLLAYEVTRDLPMTTERIQTPLCEWDAPVLEGRKLALISILRAGNGLLDGILELIPAARVGFVGLYRDPETLKPVQYYCKLPAELEDRWTIVVDPMLATGGTLIMAMDLVLARGAVAAEVSAAGEAVAAGAASDTTGMMAFRSACLNSTVIGRSPLARAVMTYCFFTSSRKLFLVSSVRVAKAEINCAVTGRVICQR